LCFLLGFLSTGMMLSLGLSLLRRPLVTAVSLAVWACVWIIMSRYADMVTMLPYSLIYAALGTLAQLSVICLPFMGRKDDRAMWHFTLRLLWTVIVSLFVGLVLWGGLSLLLLSLDPLFGVSVPVILYSDIAYVSFCLASPLLMLQGLLNNNPVTVPAFVRQAVVYLFIPLAGLYIFTLYCYSVRILVTWTLPDGWVSYLVSTSMLMVVLLKMALRHASRFPAFATAFVNRWMPVLMLPLLLLMSVGIARRLSDYGITVSRIYLTVFNLWCYAACLIIWLKKQAGIMWIPISVALLFIVLSVFPYNVSTWVRDSMVRQVQAAMLASDWDGTPMTGEDYRAWLDGLDGENAHKVESRMDYLKSKYPDDVHSRFVQSAIRAAVTEEDESDNADESDASVESEKIYLSGFQLNANTKLAIPEGMTCVLQYDDYVEDDDIEMTRDSVTASFPLDDGITFELTFPMAYLRALDKDDEQAAELSVPLSSGFGGVLSDGRTYRFFLNEFSLSRHEEIKYLRVCGILFCQ